MNRDFPRILTLLRKEQDLSQKKVAADLGISQALLSHYEKGIRECGLDFVVRAADYYQVSCDFLLGRTPQRTGAVITVRDLPAEGAARGKKANTAMGEYNRRILANSTNIVFAILKKINSESLTHLVSLYLSGAVYKIFRLLYSSDPKNPQGLFKLDRRLFGATINSRMAMIEAKSRFILTGENVNEYIGVKHDALPVMTAESINQEFPQYAPSLFDLIQNVETDAQGKKL